ncbi:polysaccharide deacetylase family protein [Paenibacillus glycanilyticus]|uniref:polysaccharide deacetylase family protein n=1 Tax=Paenibacillus glycanilyticus TaxID=126569 RepID=UPI002040B122|nr:polysaccharide deacetylase family protein [Paenibacillus glycanilyticus]MCM3629369.1 polysaccharide deacetylase family protein [Paenibacillus glycanilyticus]
MRVKVIAALLVIAIAITWPVSHYQLNAANNKPVHYKNKVIVLMYHHIDGKESEATISPGRFGTQMKLLKENGYHVISTEQLADFMKHKAKVPDNAVVITFDDGYESFDQYAVPILKKYNFTATHFIIGSSSDKQNVQTKHLTWDTMRRLKAEGFSFYSHTYHQHDYASLDKKSHKTGPMLASPIYLKDKGRVETKKEYLARVGADARLMEKRLKTELHNTYQMIAFPYGVFNRTAKQLEKEAGVTLFFTTQPGINKPGSDEVLRLNAGTPTLTGSKFLRMMKRYG